MQNVETEQYLHVQKLGRHRRIIKFIPNDRLKDKAFLPVLFAAFRQYFQQEYRHFVMDLQEFHSLPPDFIVFLLEATSRLRRHHGELYLINLSKNAEEDLITFNTSSYLTLSSHLEIAVHEIEFREESSELQLLRKTGTDDAAIPPLDVITEQHGAIEVPYDAESLYKVCEFVKKHAHEMGFSKNQISRINIAVYEACLNAIEHTQHMNSPKKFKVEVEKTSNLLQIVVWDHGPGFKVDNTKRFDVDQAVSERVTGGMGLHIIRRAMDDVNYKTDNIAGNRLVMTKYLKK